MSVEQIEIDGRKGLVVYVDKNWVPVPVDEAALAKVTFQDGSVGFYAIGDSDEPRTAGGPGSGNFGHGGRPGHVGGSNEAETPHGERGLYVDKNKTDGPLPPRGKVLASYTDEDGYTVSIIGGTPKGQEYGLGTPRYGVIKIAPPDDSGKSDLKSAVRGGFWMAWPEESWRISMHDYNSKPWEDRAAMEVKHTATSYGGLKRQYEFNVESQRRQNEKVRAKSRSAIAVVNRRAETDVHKAADRNLKSIGRVIAASFSAGRDAIDKAKLRRALSARNMKAVEDAVAGVADAMKAYLAVHLPAVLHKTVVAGGKAAAAMLPQKPRMAESADDLRTLKPRGGYLDFNFDSKDEPAQTWAEEHAAELAEDLSVTTRQNIAEALIEAFETGDLDEMEEDIIDAVGDEERGILIARTEIMKAANEGQRQSWGQAVEAGFLSGDEYREWIAVGDDKVCPECESMDGQIAPLGGQYPEPGEDGPPLHPRCRCTEGITASRS